MRPFFVLLNFAGTSDECFMSHRANLGAEFKPGREPTDAEAIVIGEAYPSLDATDAGIYDRRSAARAAAKAVGVSYTAQQFPTRVVQIGGKINRSVGRKPSHYVVQFKGACTRGVWESQHVTRKNREAARTHIQREREWDTEHNIVGYKYRAVPVYA